MQVARAVQPARTDGVASRAATAPRADGHLVHEFRMVWCWRRGVRSRARVAADGESCPASAVNAGEVWPLGAGVASAFADLDGRSITVAVDEYGNVTVR